MSNLITIILIENRKRKVFEILLYMYVLHIYHLGFKACQLAENLVYIPCIFWQLALSNSLNPDQINPDQIVPKGAGLSGFILFSFPSLHFTKDTGLLNVLNQVLRCDKKITLIIPFLYPPIHTLRRGREHIDFDVDLIDIGFCASYFDITCEQIGTKFVWI